MVALARVRVALTGFPGGPGVATFYGLDGGVLAADLQAFMVTAGSLFMSDVTIQVPPGGDVIEDTTGVITGSWTGGVFAAQHGVGVGSYAAPSGILIEWLTSTILDGKRVRGRTFLVPVASTNYGADGQVLPADVAGLTVNGNTLVNGSPGNFVIWHRPRLARAATLRLKALTAHPGGHAVVTGVRVDPKVTVLRSRRD